MRCESWAFLFHKGCKMAGMCLICALLSKKCLAVCLTLCLASDARRDVLGGFRPGKFAGGLGVAAVRAGWRPPGAFPSQGRVQRVPVCLLVRGRSDRGRGGYYSRRGLWSASSAGRCPVWLSLPALWMISPAERRCSVQRGRRSGCVLLGMDAAGVGCCLCCHAGHGTM